MTPIDSTLNCDLLVTCDKIQYMYIFESDIIDLQRIGRLVSGDIGLLLQRLQPIGPLGALIHLCPSVSSMMARGRVLA